MQYARQVQYKNIGEDRQSFLSTAHILIIGCGALGTHFAEMLIRSGLGHISIVDPDIIEMTNLHRQTLFTAEDIGKQKVSVAKEYLEKISPSACIEVYGEYFGENFFPQMSAQNISLILDGSDNLETRYMMNSFAFRHNIPWIYCGVGADSFISKIFFPGKTSCFKCIFGDDQGEDSFRETCENDGIILPTIYNASALVIMQAMKICMQKFSEADMELITGNIWENTIQRFKIGEKYCDLCRKG